MTTDYKYVRFFDEIGSADVALVGGKNAGLGEVYNELRSVGVPVPNGFAITADAYRLVLDQAGAWEALHGALDGIDATDVESLADGSKRARQIVYTAEFPRDLEA